MCVLRACVHHGANTNLRLGLCQGEKPCIPWRVSDLSPDHQLLLHLSFSDHEEQSVTTPSSSLTHPFHSLTIRSTLKISLAGEQRKALIHCLNLTIPWVIFTVSLFHCRAAGCFCCDHRQSRGSGSRMLWRTYRIVREVLGTW